MTLDVGHGRWTLDVGRWTLNFRTFGLSDIRRWTLENVQRWTLDVGHGTLDIRMLGVESWTIGNLLNVSCCMLDVGRHDVGRCTLHVGRQNVGRQTQDVQHSDVGLLTLDVGLWAVDVWTLGVGRGRSYVFSWMLSAARSTRWTMDVGSWALDTLDILDTLDVGTFGRSDVGLDFERERDVGLWMFDSARCTLHVVRPFVGRCGLDGRHWLLGCWMLDVGSDGRSAIGRADVGYWTSDVERWTLNFGTLGIGCWTLLDVGTFDVWTLDVGRKMLDVERWTWEVGCRMLDIER